MAHAGPARAYRPRPRPRRAACQSHGPARRSQRAAARACAWQAAAYRASWWSSARARRQCCRSMLQAVASPVPAATRGSASRRHPAAGSAGRPRQAAWACWSLRAQLSQALRRAAWIVACTPKAVLGLVVVVVGVGQDRAAAAQRACRTRAGGVASSRQRAMHATSRCGTRAVAAWTPLASARPVRLAPSAHAAAAAARHARARAA